MLSAMRSLTTTVSSGCSPSYSSQSSSSVITLSSYSSSATSYPQSENAPSVNFMMLPLWTSVTESRSLASA